MLYYALYIVHGFVQAVYDLNEEEILDTRVQLNVKGMTKFPALLTIQGTITSVAGGTASEFNIIVPRADKWTTIVSDRESQYCACTEAESTEAESDICAFTFAFARSRSRAYATVSSPKLPYSSLQFRCVWL